MNERTEKELQKLIETINYEIRSNIESINNYIEFCCARVLKEGIKLYEYVHDWDPYYDHSGRLVETGIYITPDNCELTIEEFWELHTGNSWASYVSGCGLFYECYDKIFEEALRHSTTTIQNNVIMQAVQNHKLDSFLQEMELEDFEEDEIIEAIWEELDGETLFTKPLVHEMNNKRRELEEQYCVNVDFEPQFYSV